MSNFELSVRFFLQVAVILGACRLVALVVRYVWQPPVVSEMIVGVVLGPSVVGALFPGFSARLFPAQSMPIIYAFAQVGMVLYMFIVGIEFRADLFKERLRTAVAISVTGMLVPFGLGVVIAWATHGDKGLFAQDAGPGLSMLYMGAAMSITAFPMLARIIHERGLSGTSLGSLVLAAGALGDAMAWCVLAVVLGAFQADRSIAGRAIGGGLVYTLGCLLVLRPLLRPLGRYVERTRALNNSLFGFVLVLVMLGAWFTDRVGIYAVFGAFIMGAAMPRGVMSDELQRRINPLTTALLVPLFFVYSGLNTKLGLVDTPALWLLAGVILAAACVGKGLACFAAAKLAGETTRQSLAIGALMNARGMMELIILNIGYERGLITQTLFSIMVFMTVVTSLMATPAFELALGRRRVEVA